MQQDKKVLLNRVVNKIRDDLGKFTYVKSSIKALDLSNRFRLKNILQRQLEILENLMRITNHSIDSTSQKTFFEQITKCIKRIDDKELTTTQVQKIFEKIIDVFNEILKHGRQIDKKIDIFKKEKEKEKDREKDRESDISKIENIRVELSKDNSETLHNLYIKLTDTNFSVSLDKVPEIYLGNLQDCEGEPGLATKACRLAEAFFRWNVVKTVSITDSENVKNNEYKKIINNVIELQKLDLTCLVTMRYLHNELKNYFIITNQAVFELATNLSHRISLIQKVTERSISREILKETDLSEYEKNILTKILEDKKVPKNAIQQSSKSGETEQPVTVDQEKSSLVQVNINSETFSCDLHALIKFIKENFENKSEVSPREEFVTIFEDEVDLAEDLNNIKIKLENCEKQFTENIKYLAENLKKLEYNKEAKANATFIPDVKNITELIHFYNINRNVIPPSRNSTDGIITYVLSSKALMTFSDLYNLCFDSLSHDEINATGITYASLFAIRSFLEKSIKQLGEEGRLIIDYEFSLFSNVVDLNQQDKASETLVNAQLKNFPVNEIKDHLNKLIHNYKQKHTTISSANINAFKYYLNLHQYRILSNRFAEFYIAHYFNIKSIEEYYNQTICYIISINQDIETKSKISNTSFFNLQTKSNSFNKEFEEYRKESSKLLSNHLNIYGNTSAIYQLLKKVKMEFFVKRQEYDVKIHEWLIKMYDLNNILSYLNKNDVPHLRMMLYIQGIFDYFEVVDTRIFKPSYNKKNLIEVRDQLIEMFKKQELEKGTDASKFAEIIKGLNALNSLLRKDHELHQLFESFINYFKNLFRDKKDIIYLKSKISERIEKLVQYWEEIFKLMGKEISKYKEDLVAAEKYISEIENTSFRLAKLQSLPTFNSQLNIYCQGHLDSNQQPSEDDIYLKVANLIKDNWREFAKLQPYQGKEFGDIYKLSFIKTSVRFYLKDNYSNIYVDVAHDDKKIFNCFKKILTFSLWMEDSKDLKNLITNNVDDNNLLILSLSNSPHQQMFKDIVDYNLLPENFNTEVFTKDIFEFLISNSNNSACSWFTPIFNARLEQCKYNFKNESPYEQFCKTYININASSEIPIIQNALQVKSHEDVMNSLAQTFGVKFKEVYTGSIVEQSLVGLAGIYTDQSNACYRRESTTTTFFLINFSNAVEQAKFVAFYNENFAGFIKSANAYQANQLTKIVVDTSKLCQDVALSLSNLHKITHV